ncbi:hypothetical protein H9P43_008505 [Blastocladiella emersonii ATCC 22665]|nr:hypothetical protein H9P43_008505 [Blastocladiella emersonii ATCC 22665]
MSSSRLEVGLWTNKAEMTHDPASGVNVVGKLCQSSGHFAEALVNYQYSLWTRWGASSLMLHVGLVSVLRDLGDWPRILDKCQDAIRKYPSWARTLNPFMIYACQQLGQRRNLDASVIDKIASVMATAAASTSPNALSILGNVVDAIARNRMDGEFRARVGALQLEGFHLALFDSDESGRALADDVRNALIGIILEFVDLLRETSSSPSPTASSAPASPSITAAMTAFIAWFASALDRCDRLPKTFAARELAHSVCRSLVVIWLQRHPEQEQPLVSSDLALPGRAYVPRAALAELWVRTANLATSAGRGFMAEACIREARSLLPLVAAGTVGSADEMARATATRIDLADLKFCNKFLPIDMYIMSHRYMSTPDDPPPPLPRLTVDSSVRWGPPTYRNTAAFQRARLHLYLARWMFKDGSAGPATTMCEFFAACCFCPNWGKSHFIAGEYIRGRMLSATTEAFKTKTRVLAVGSFAYAACFSQDYAVAAVSALLPLMWTPITIPRPLPVGDAAAASREDIQFILDQVIAAIKEGPIPLNLPEVLTPRAA